MNSSWRTEWPTVVAGVGSAHGDDQAGWRVAAILSRLPDLPACVISVHEPTQILEALRGCERLIVIDACNSGGRAVAVTRLVWPDPRIAIKHRHSTHGVGVADILKLAEKLGDLPPSVEIFGIETANCSPGQEMSPEVERAAAEVADEIAGSLREVEHA